MRTYTCKAVKKENMAADKAKESNLQVVGEESKDLEGAIKIVDTVFFFEL